MDKELQEDNPRGVEVRRASPQVEVAPRGLLELEHRVLQQLVTLLDSCMSPMLTTGGTRAGPRSGLGGSDG